MKSPAYKRVILCYYKIMDIFVIEIIDADNVHQELLLEFKKKEISNPKKLNEHCLSYLMVDRILREFYQIEDREIHFQNHKPMLKSGLKHFSISHCEAYIALAFSDTPCGIDIEQNKPRNYNKIAARLKFSSNSLDDFYTDWTLFEANYKLGTTAKISKTYKLGDYTLSAVSENVNENFELYIQSSQYIPQL